MSLVRILAIGDTHDHPQDYAPDLLPEADLCIVTGDLTEDGARGERAGSGEMDRARGWLASLAERYPVYWIAGNHDMEVRNDTFGVIPNCTAIEGVTLTLDALPATLHGINLSPCFNAPMLKRVWDKMTDSRDVDAAAFDAIPPVDILVSHCPPEGCADASPRGIPLGSPGLRAYIERHRPRLVLCGHIHERGGQYAWLPKTPSKPGAPQTLVVNVACTPTLIAISFADPSYPVRIETNKLGRNTS